jgi:spore maturation protein CgeB
MQAGGNMRTFEVASIGTLQLIDRCDSEWFEDDEEIVSYSDLEDLRSKVIFYLKNNNAREQIGIRGRVRAQRDHTYMTRMESILRVLTA